MASQTKEASTMHKRYYFFAVFILSLIAIIIPTVMSTWLNTPVMAPIILGNSADQVITLGGAGDVASYVKGAQVLLDHQDPRQSWTFQNWAPGMMITEAVILTLFGGIHFVMAMFCLTALLWSLVFAVCATILSRIADNRWFPLCLLFCFFCPLFYPVLFIQAILLSEALSIAFFISGVFVLGYGISRSSIRYSVTGSCLITISAILRVQFVPVIFLFCAMIIISSAAAKINLLVSRLTIPPISLKISLLAFGIFFLTFISYSLWNNGKFVHNEGFYANAWRAPSVPPDFDDVGGGRVFCTIKPDKCAEYQRRGPSTVSWQEYRRETVRIILHHPVRIIRLRFPYFIEAFFSTQGWGIHVDIPSIIENSLIGLASLAAFSGSLILSKTPFFRVLFFALIATWVGSLIVPFLMFHFEVRYFFPAKALSIFSFMAVLAAVGGKIMQARQATVRSEPQPVGLP